MGVYKGIIYRYFLTNEKGIEMSYVGQTCSEKKRRSDFMNVNIPYGGKRIENARRKYTPYMFSYEVVESVECKTIEERSELLNRMEIYYIDFFNSFRKGYNNTIGGGGAKGYLHTDEYKKWQSDKSKELAKNPLYRVKISNGIKSFYDNNPNARTKKSEEVKTRYKGTEARAITSMAHKKSHAANPERAKNQAKKLSKTCSTVEGRKRMSETIKNAWQTSEYREKYSKSKKALWATPEYREKMALAYKGMNGKRVLQSTLDDKTIKEYESATEAARFLGLSFGGVSRACRGERKQYKGYKWSYID